MKDSFYMELDHAFDKCPKYHMKIVLGDFNVEVGRKTFSNQKLGMRILTQLIIIMALE
jgi:hypothetical protein